MNTLFTSGQVVTIAVGETYTLKTDEVMINNSIYKKVDLEITMNTNDTLADATKVKLGVHKRDGRQNSPAEAKTFNNWTIDTVVQTVLATCIEGISAGIR
jgi:hypothetical protein